MNYPPFQVITSSNDEPVNEPLNKAVYALLKAYGIDFYDGRLEPLEKSASVFSNVPKGSVIPHTQLLYGTRSDRTDILTFDARTEFGKLVGFLEKPPKGDVTHHLKGASSGYTFPVVISKDGVRCEGLFVTHASIIELGKKVEEYIK